MGRKNQVSMRVACSVRIGVPPRTVFRLERRERERRGTGTGRERRNGGNGVDLLSPERRACWNGGGTGTAERRNTENGNGNGNGGRAWNGERERRRNGNGGERRRAQERRAGTIPETEHVSSGTQFLFREQESFSVSALFRLRLCSDKLVPSLGAEGASCPAWGQRALHA